jgi:broad specificity phosphatase PhoE
MADCLPESADRADGPLRVSGPTLLLIRHATVASHRGDVPLTRDGRAQAEAMGRGLAELNLGSVDIRVAPTRRAHETGHMILQGLKTAQPSVIVTGPSVASALRNPDLYLVGHRVEMVSTAAAFAHQAPGVTEADVIGLEFFASFLGSKDRIGYWLRCPHPPGDDVTAVTTRVRHFAQSLRQARPGSSLVLGVTHSPVLRALATHCLGSDPGEPGYLHGYALPLLDDGGCDDLHARRCEPAELEQWQGGTHCRK